MRPESDEYFIAMSLLVASRATCARRRVGCVLVNERKHVLATGYNGVAAGAPHCYEVPCEGANAPSGTGLDLCEASHAEMNALLQCPDPWKIHTAYVTASPCVQCIKLLMNTSCKRIVFLDEYPHGKSKTLWEGLEREWVKFETKNKGLITDIRLSMFTANITGSTASVAGAMQGVLDYYSGKN